MNSSSLGIEHEPLMLKTISEGTKIDYVNDVEIRSLFFRIFGKILIGTIALKYWEYAVINKLKKILEQKNGI